MRFYISQRVEHELLIVFHVFGQHLYLEIELATGLITLRNLVDVHHCIAEFLDVRQRVARQSHVAEHRYMVAHLVSIDHCHVSFYVSLALKPLLALEAWARETGLSFRPAP